MARIRTVKPEFWEDEIIATLSRDARLLFIATLNMADDEGLLRWTPEFIKANAFMYDDDLPVPDVEKLMQELTEAELLLAYRAGRPQRQLAWVINFRKHQNINRPQPSKLPAPSIQSNEVWTAYKRRDGMTCHLCKGTVSEQHDEPKLFPSLDHVTPRSKGGSDYPSNIKLAHETCNKARGNREPGASPSQHAPSVPDSPPDSLPESVNPPVSTGVSGSLNDSVNASVSGSLPEQGTGNREGNREQGREGARARVREVPPSTILGNGLLEEHTRQITPTPPRDVTRRTGEQINLLLDDSEITPDEIRAGLALLRSKPKLAPGALPSLVHQIRQENAHPELASRASPRRGNFRGGASDPLTDQAYGPGSTRI